MIGLDDVAATLFRIAEALEGLSERTGAEPDPEADGCCDGMSEAHEHGRKLGRDEAMKAVHDAFEEER